MTGPAAKLAFDKAAALVKDGKYLDAILVDLRDSDIVVIVKKIKNACANTANLTKEKT